MTTKKKPAFSFRFNPNEEDLLEEILSNRDSDETSEDLSTSSTPSKAESTKSDTVVTTERRVKYSTSENSGI